MTDKAGRRMTLTVDMRIDPIGVVRSSLHDQASAPKQGNEGAPNAWLVLDPRYQDAARDIAVGDEVLLLTWLDRADRTVLRVHPRDDPRADVRGVFSTRSQDRPNPVGVHRVRVLRRKGALELEVSELEALDGTPMVDIKPVLDRLGER